MRCPTSGMIVLAAAIALAGPRAHADEKQHDHDAARQAVERGEIKPLSEILAGVRDQLPGQVIRVEVERKKGRWLYELRLADARGQLFEAHVDGATGAVLQVKRK